MDKYRGCINDSCVSNRKKTIYKKEEAFCPHCGHPVVPVCRKCFKQLEEGTDKYCIRCRAEKDDKDYRQRKAAANAAKGLGVAALAVAVKKVRERFGL